MSDPFGALALFREQPIPDRTDSFRLKQGYRDHHLDLSTEASTEPLVDARTIDLRGENYYASTRNPPHYKPIEGSVSQLWVREGVAERLVRVDRQLRREGLRLWLFDAWRPTAVQAFFHDEWMPQHVRDRHPDLSPEEVLRIVETYWAAPTEAAASPAPHLTGAAVDLTLCWDDSGERLWMGSLFDDVSEIAEAAYFEVPRSTSYSKPAQEARANRRLLYWSMTGAGFCANPAEWWHFSYGDQMWARLTGKGSALYGAAEPPSEAPVRTTAA